MAIDLILKRMQNHRTSAEVTKLIMADVNSSDPNLRQRALTTLDFLTNEEVTSARSRTWSDASSSSPHTHDVVRSHSNTFAPSVQLPIAGWEAIPRERPVGDTEIRRRRREAVVLHEGAGDINEDDIIRPVYPRP